MLNIDYPYAISLLYNGFEYTFRYSIKEKFNILDFSVILETDDGKLDFFRAHEFTFDKKTSKISNTTLEVATKLVLRDYVINEILKKEKLIDKK